MEENIIEKNKVLIDGFMENVVTYLISGIRKGKWKSAGLTQGINIDLYSDFVLETDYDPKNKRFLHFTPLRTLLSILNENAIRLYNLKNVNDPNEYDFMAEDLVPYEDPDLIKSDTFILSLCDIDVLHGSNILNLWRLYGDGGLGVAIEFEIDVTNVFNNYYLGKVLYDKIDFSDFKNRKLDFEARNNASFDISNLIRIAACFHKNHYFRIEEEIRLMLCGETGISNEDTFFHDINGRNEPVRYHRLKFGQSLNDIPYITIKRIQLGFRHSTAYFLNFQSHLWEIFSNMRQNGIWEDDLPIIEHSPLTNIYR